jgi:hypothetical protein
MTQFPVILACMGLLAAWAQRAKFGCPYHLGLKASYQGLAGKVVVYPPRCKILPAITPCDGHGGRWWDLKWGTLQFRCAHSKLHISANSKWIGVLEVAGGPWSTHLYHLSTEYLRIYGEVFS